MTTQTTQTINKAKKTTSEGYITYINTNTHDYLSTQTTIEFDESNNINDLNDLIQLILDSGFNNYYNKIYSMKINDTYYLQGFDKIINILNNIINDILETS